MIQIAKNTEILDNLPDINPDFDDAETFIARRNLSLASLSEFKDFILQVKDPHKKKAEVMRFLDPDCRR